MSSAASPLTKLQPSRIRIACALLVFIASLVVYAFTLAPTVTLVDSGELIVAAHSLGVAHPPGFPLYVMLAHLASLVPIGSVAVRINFASALLAALASSVVALVVIEAMLISPLPRQRTVFERKQIAAREVSLQRHPSSLEVIAREVHLCSWSRPWLRASCWPSRERSGDTRR